MRKPSIKRSIRARTTGKIKRKIKRTVNPLYGKKGMGFIKNPRKAVYNKIYNKTTFSAWGIFGLFGHKRRTNAASNKQSGYTHHTTAPSNNQPGCFRMWLPIILIVVGFFTIPVGLIFIAIGFFLLAKRGIQNRAGGASAPDLPENETMDENETTGDEE
jgi:hypothetical protein